MPQNHFDSEEDEDEDGMIYTRHPQGYGQPQQYLPSCPPHYQHQTKATRKSKSLSNSRSGSFSNISGSVPIPNASSGILAGMGAAGLRPRAFGSAAVRDASRERERDRESREGEREVVPKCISTTPGVLGAGETETEADEPPHHLPTSRIHAPPSYSYSSLFDSEAALLQLLFEISRWLSIVPAVFGTLWNLWGLWWCFFGGGGQVGGVGEFGFTATGAGRRDGVEYGVAALWSILTGYQHLSLTTGLLSRWRTYYTPLPTLIRLLGLQAICWPATHFTLVVLDVGKRPLVCWCVIGTCTSISKAVQLWVTSNLEAVHDGQSHSTSHPREHPLSHSHDRIHASANGTTARPRSGGRWERRLGVAGVGDRRLDWGEIGVKCALPAGVVYFVMAWVGVLQGEVWGC
ncbi:hypothetical protein JAAARDRAFT_253155 [Jaapia argillacea MUCL 33604]|uniref:Uncharacterized protein n=1 Tax=Jaapia argillacea MUCL 33604 TaxID=933084 RepID=A0A067PT40_9AGAM|nr:hypothetical protein JAAARDRAFT_253155 [Jaapia argillacea MUCL 33604]